MSAILLSFLAVSLSLASGYSSAEVLAQESHAVVSAEQGLLGYSQAPSPWGVAGRGFVRASGGFFLHNNLDMPLDVSVRLQDGSSCSIDAPNRVVKMTISPRRRDVEVVVPLGCGSGASGVTYLVEANGVGLTIRLTVPGSAGTVSTPKTVTGVSVKQ